MKSCPDHGSLARASGLPVEHPVRVHLRECARCRAALLAMTEFESPGSPPDLPAAELDDAKRRLQDFIDGDLLATGDSPRPRSMRPAGPRALAWIAAAALVLVSLGLWQLGPGLRDVGRETTSAMRGEVVGQSDGLSPVLSSHDAGTATLSWSPVDGADDYLVVFLDASLVELGRTEPVVGDSSEITPRGAWLVVIARQAGREIARSEPLRLP